MGGDGIPPMKDASLTFAVNFDEEEEVREGVGGGERSWDGVRRGVK